MKRYLVLLVCFLLTLSLSSCRAPFSMPRAQEPRGIALASVLALERDETDSIRIVAASQERGQTPVQTYESKAPSISGAILASRDRGTESVSYAHIEHLVMDEQFAERNLSDLFSFSFQNGEQSIESKVWILRDAPIDSLFAEGADPAGRLSVLQSGGAANTSLPSRSLRALASKWADDGAILIPALRIAEGEVLFDSYAIYKDGKILDYLSGERAIGSVLLSGEPFHWSEAYNLEENKRVSVQLYSKGCSVKPHLQDGHLKSLEVTCKLRGSITEGWSPENLNSLTTQVERQVYLDLLEANETLRSHGADAASLRRQAGLKMPLKWDVINANWAKEYMNLPIEYHVSLRLDEGL